MLKKIDWNGETALSTREREGEREQKLDAGRESQRRLGDRGENKTLSSPASYRSASPATSVPLCVHEACTAAATSCLRATASSPRSEGGSGGGCESS